MPELLGEFTPPIKPNLPALFLYRGLSDSQVDQLIAFTQIDEDVRKFDSDDDRFGSRELYNIWLKKGRTIYALADSEGNLFGIYWIGKKELPRDRRYLEEVSDTDYPYTMATRLYGPAKGHRLSTRFVLEATEDFVKLNKLSQAGFWAEVSAENQRSLHKNLAAGYRIVSEPGENGKVIMVQDFSL